MDTPMKHPKLPPSEKGKSAYARRDPEENINFPLTPSLSISILIRNPVIVSVTDFATASGTASATVFRTYRSFA